VVPTPPEQGPLWQELGAFLIQHKVNTTGPCLTIYHDPEYKEHDWDVEVCERIGAALPGSERVRIRDLPGVEMMACTIHHGPFITISQAYGALMQWIQDNGYRIAGPGREVYLREAENTSQTDPNTVTEIQFPVEKA
jgi:effector-binding domain-containing protein